MMHVEILYKYHMFSNGSHLRIVGFCCKCMLQAVICPRSSVSISHYIQIGSSKLFASYKSGKNEYLIMHRMQ